MVNPDVDDYTETLNHRKNIPKNAKTTVTYWKPNAKSEI